MNELINKQYANLICNSADFRAFVKKTEKYSNDELLALYEAENEVISCLADPYKTQSLK